MLAATSPDLFAVNPNSQLYSDGGVFAAETWGTPITDSAGRSVIDLTVNPDGDQVYRLEFFDDPSPTLDFQIGSKPALFDPWIHLASNHAYRFEGDTNHIPADLAFDLKYTALDADGLSVLPIHVNQFPGSTDTTLVQQVDPGDDFIVVADANGWSHDSASTASTRALAWYGYEDALGTRYEDYSYTRNVLGDRIEGAWQADGISFDTTLGGYRIALSTAWSSASLPAGTAVRNAIADGNLFYLDALLYNRAEDAKLRRTTAALEQLKVYSNFGDQQWDPQKVKQAAIAPGVTSIKLGSTLPIRNATIRHDGDETAAGPALSTFDGDLRHVASRSLEMVESDLPVTVDPNRSYTFGVFAGVHSIGTGVLGSETHSIGYTAFDTDGLRINSEHVARFPGAADTTLASDLAPGDKQMVLANTFGWNGKGTDPASRTMAWYGYVDSTGKLYEDYTYTRNVAGDSVLGLWPIGGINGNTIQLTQPWEGPALAAGTAVRNAVGGQTLQAILVDDSMLSATPQRYTSTAITGTWTEGNPDATAFPPGTESIRPAAIFNQSSFTQDDIVTLESFSVSQVGENLVMPSPISQQYTLQFDVLANDLISHTADVELVSASSSQFGSVTILGNGLVQYASAPWFVGKDQFTYTVEDLSNGQRWTETVSVVIRGSNVDQEPQLLRDLSENESNQPIAREPIALDDNANAVGYRVAAGQTLVVDGSRNPRLLNNDSWTRLAPEHAASVSLLHEPQHGVLSFNYDGTYSYTSDPQFVGLDYFQYAIFDGLRTDTATVSIEVVADSVSVVRRNLNVLALGMHDFHGAYHQLPVRDEPEYLDEEGRPHLSWRVFLLPFLNHHELYNQFHLDEPWDSPHNLTLQDKMPDIYGDGLASSDFETRIQTLTSHYLAPDDRYGPVGFKLDRPGIQFRDVRDGLTNTLLLVQVGEERSVPWTAPLDAPFDYDAPLSTLGEIAPNGVPVVMFDGTTAILPADIDAETFASLATRLAFPTEALVDTGTLSRQFDAEAWDAKGSRQDLNFRKIGIAFQNYQAAYREFAPNNGTRGRDSDGHFQLSWRVYLLPFLDHQQLWERFNLDEPWDSPNNIVLVNEMPDIFRSYGDLANSNMTRIKTVVGEGAAYGHNADGSDYSPSSGDFLDGTSNTFLVLETGPDQAVPWTQPDEFQFDPAAPLANLGNLPDEFFRALMADGSILKLPANIDNELFVALATRASSSFYAPLPRPIVEGIDANTLRRRYSDRNPTVLSDYGSNQLRQVTLGWHNFHAAFNQLPTLPDSSHYDSEGKPLLSWRVHLLPFIGFRPLWEEFHQNEPWDSPHNLSLLPYMPDIFRSVDDQWDSVTTRIQTFVDGGTEEFGFTDGAPFSSFGMGPHFRDMLDGLSSTILMVQSGQDVAVPWTKPADVTFDRNAPLDQLGDIGSDFLTVRMDGSVQLERVGDDLARLITLIRPRDRTALTYRSDATVMRSEIMESDELGKIDVHITKQDIELRSVVDTTIDIVVADPSILRVFPTSLTFDNDNYELPQSVTFQAIDNGLVDGPKSTTVTIGDQSFEITVIDDDSFHLVLDRSLVEVDESGTQVIRFVSLDAAPIGDVVIDLSSDDPDEVAVTPATLTFNAANWDQAQPMMLAGVADDALVDGDQHTIIRILVDPLSSDPNFAQATAQVAVLNRDINVADFLVAPSAQATATEGDIPLELSIQLSSRPTSNVIVDVSVGDSNQLLTSKTSIIFTPLNWDQTQHVGISAIDDLLVDGNFVSNVTFSINPTSAIAFRSVDSQIVEVVVDDNDVAGFTVIETSGRTVASESGDEDSFSVQLSAAPLDDVLLRVESDDTSEVGLSTTSLVFTTANWNQPQTVTVSGIDDDLVDGVVASTLTVSVDASSDAAFRLLPSQTLAVTTTDNDLAGFTVSQTGDSTIVSEAGDQDSFSVQLSAAPLTDVLLKIESNDASEVGLSTTSLLFTTANWN
ncbi:DUF1559 domain-containing protein [Novipirellula herctigrandis]